MCSPKAPDAPPPPPKMPEAPSMPDAEMSQSRRADQQYRRSRNMSNTLLTNQPSLAPQTGPRATLLSGLNG